jgi:hypothetical protein
VAFKTSKNMRNRTTLIYFTACLSFGFAGTAFTNVVLRNDLLATLFGAGICFALVALQQDRDQVQDVKIHDFGSIIKGELAPDMR